MIDKKETRFNRIDNVFESAKKSIEQLEQFKDDDELSLILIVGSRKYGHGEGLIHGRGDTLAESLYKAFNTEKHKIIFQLANIYMHEDTK